MKANYRPSRRGVLGHTAGLAAAVAAGVWPDTHPVRPDGIASRRTRPNIVLILLDDVGYGDWSSYGSREISTPHIDRVGATGVTFPQMYSAAAVCMPARAALLTGRYPQRVGLPWVLYPGARDGLPGYERTVAELLRGRGYRTGIFGKWHLGDFGARSELHPAHHGFDKFFGTPSFNMDEPFPLYDGAHVIDMLEQEEQVSLSRRCTDGAVEFIRDDAEPFFLYLAYHLAHKPYHVEERFRGSSAAGPYGDLVQQADFHVGRVMRELETRGLADDTLVIVTSDNGPEEHNGGGLRAGKGFTFEGGIRVPCVARWPGHILPRTTHRHPACFTDVLPTLASVAGAAIPDDRAIDGVDLSTSWQGLAAPERTLYHYHDWTLNAVRDGSWKLHLPGRRNGLRSGPADDDDNEEPLPPLLYHIDRDRGEEQNLAAKYPRKVRELTELGRRFDAPIQAQKDKALGRARGDG